MSATPFQIGQRVIVTRWKAGTRNTDMNGYYGHVTETHPRSDPRLRPLVSVSLKGRVGSDARPHDLDLDGDDPWIFYVDELEHAD